MIIKGKSRGNGAQLGPYLLKRGENEDLRAVEIRGLAADNVPDAVREMDALGAGARTKKSLYHASINTPADERLSDKQWAIAVDRLEERLGLTGQPRVVVMHEKKGRVHTHIVWSRIDLERMAAISDSNNFAKHEAVARELEREFGLRRVQGVHVERDGKERPRRTPDYGEMQQSARSGLSPQQVTEEVTRIWRSTDNGKAFAAGLSDAGYILARGDRRDFVIVDPKAGTHSLARRIEGARVKDVRERLADIDAGLLPSVVEAKAIQRERMAERHREKGQSVGSEISPTAEKGLPTTGPVARTHEKPGAAGRAADGVTRGVGSIFDGLASLFENALSGRSTEAEEEQAPETPLPPPAIDPNVRVDEEERAKRHQELAREFGRYLEDERDAETERERRRSR